MASIWGEDAMLFHGRYHGMQVYFAFYDQWVNNPQILQQIKNERKKLVMITPIDQSPVPQGVLNNLRYADKIISISKYGQRELQKSGFVSQLIVEGVDTSVFKPLDKQACRKLFNIPSEAFVVGMVGANKENPSRKNWQQALEAFSLFHQKHPESIFFYQSNQNQPSGFPIRPFAHHLGLDKAISSLDEYIGAFHFGSPQMAQLLNSFDILTHASASEGFGLIICESQACGTPVVVNDCQSQPELIVNGKTGLICKTGFKFYSNAGGFYHMPDVSDLYSCYEKLFRADRKEMGRLGRIHVETNYNIDRLVQNQWIPLLQDIQAEILGKSPITKA